MLVLRILFLLAALAIVVSGGMYLFTRNQWYLKLAWQIARFVLFSLLIFGLLYILERYALIGWRVIL